MCDTLCKPRTDSAEQELYELADRLVELAKKHVQAGRVWADTLSSIRVYVKDEFMALEEGGEALHEDCPEDEGE